MRAKHFFLDEAGDTTFYGKGKTIIVGQNGVSNCFILGMLQVNEPLPKLREKVQTLQNQMLNDAYFAEIRSMEKKKRKYGYYFHATDDVPEVRKVFYEFIKKTDCRFEAIIGRKIQTVFERKHNGRERDFYADLLSHLIEDKLDTNQKLVLNVSERGTTTKHTNLALALEKSVNRFLKNNPDGKIKAEVVFNVQNPLSEPLINMADYCCWAIQRVIERGETRYCNFIKDKIGRVVDLYDFGKIESGKNIYDAANWLTENNKISPLLP